MIGYTLKELGPMCIDTWAKYCHPDDLKRSRELLEKHFRGELPYYDSELRMRHRSGEWIWVLARGKVVSRTGDGKPLLMFGSHLDITERKRAEEALKIAKEQAEAASKAKSEFLANMAEVKLAIYQAMRVQGVSQVKLASLLGTDPKSVRRLLDLFHTSRWDHLEMALEALGYQARVTVEPVAQVPALAARSARRAARV